MSKDTQDNVGMSYLDTNANKIFKIYLPLLVFLFVLLFPFYWMGITAFKPDNELLSRDGNPFWIVAPTLAHVEKPPMDVEYGRGFGHGHILLFVCIGVSGLRH